LIRLSRGSGIQGLSSMKSSVILDGKIKLLRPLLDIKKEDLIFTAKKIFGKIFKDPSNYDKKYLRTRMRSLKKILETSGISHEQIIRSIKNLASSSDTLNKYIEKIYKLNVKKEKKRISINFKNISMETKEIQLKILSKVLVVFSKSYYPPRSKKILNVINTLGSGKVKKMTLSGCIVERYGNQLFIRKEA
jgi:tRNA(Ile)-lysidine synthase